MNIFAVNLSTIFTEEAFLARFKKARDYGFSLVECQFPYAYPIKEIQNELTKNELSLVLLNLPSGDWDKGDRGIAADPERREEFEKSVQAGIEYATALNVSNIHCMAGVVRDGDYDTARNAFIKNIEFAASEMAKHNLTLLIEPINTFSMPAYFLNDLHEAAEIIKTIGLANIKLQFDFYHIERIHGNSLELFHQYRELVGHVQIADTPDRHEPGTGEIDYPLILNSIKDTQKGYIGLEYIPKGRSEESFEWMQSMVNGGSRT